MADGTGCYSRRQYTSQLQKWGVQKNKTRVKNAIPIDAPREPSFQRIEDPYLTRNKSDNWDLGLTSGRVCMSRPPLDSSPPQGSHPDPRIISDITSGNQTHQENEHNPSIISFRSSSRMDVNSPMSLSSPSTNPQSDDAIRDGYGLIDSGRNKMLFAGFFFTFRCYERSFALYFSVLKSLDGPSGTCESLMTSVIIGCARSCVTAPHLKIAQDILERELPKWLIADTSITKGLLYRLLLAEVCFKQGKIGPSEFHNSEALSAYSAWVKSLRGRSRNGRKRPDLIAFHYLGEALSRRGHSSWIRDMDLQARQLIYEDFDQVDSHLVRSCLQWCVDEWTKNGSINVSVMSLGPGGQEEPLLAFYELWFRYYQQQPWTSIGWMLSSEEGILVTPSELLFVTCLTIFNALPARENNFVIPSLQYEITLYVSRRFFEGCVILSKRSDHALYADFFESFTLSQPDAKMSFDHPLVLQKFLRSSVSSSTENYEYIKRFLQDNLELQRPNSRQLTETNFQQITVTSNVANPRSSLSSRTSLIPTIASSLRSSDLESLRSLRERIRNRTTNLRSASQDHLPSDGMSIRSSSSIGWVSSIIKREFFQGTSGARWSRSTGESPQSVMDISVS